MVRALLEPIAKLREYEANGQGFQRLALLEEEKDPEKAITRLKEALK